MNQFSNGATGFAFPRLTPAVKGLLILNGVVFLCQFVFFLSTRDTFAPYLGVSLPGFRDYPWFAVFQLVTYQFVHDTTGIGHIAINMLILYFFGTMVEERIGSRRLVRFYLLAGICGGVFWLIFSALTGQGIPCVGASGAVYGIVAYAALMNPRARVIMIIVVIPLWVVAAVLAAGAIVSTLASLRLGAGTGVADAAHLGGMAYALVRWRFGPQMAAWRLRFEGLMRERERGRRRARENELDRLLQKIKEVGMGGLSSSERRFLSRYSKDERK